MSASAREREVRGRQARGSRRVTRPTALARMQRQAPLLALNDFGDQVVAPAASSCRAALRADLRHIAGASGSHGATDVSVSEGVAMTDQH